MNKKEKNEDVKRELEQLSPGFPDRKPVSPPPGYFDEFPGRMMNRWNEQTTTKSPVILNMRKMIAVAAVVTGICLGIAWWSRQSVLDVTSPSISAADAYQYILENFEEFESLILQEGLPPEGVITEWPGPQEIEQYLIEEIDADEIENMF